MKDEETERTPLIERLTAVEQEIKDWRAGKIQLYTRIVTFPGDPPEFTAEDVRKIRASLNMSRAEFARFLNVSPRTIESWEHGHRTPKGDKARLLELYTRPEVVARWRLDGPPAPGRRSPKAPQEQPVTRNRTKARHEVV
ncbi:MAG: helix-turn-helix domain-containing protein [Armatimonadetes bacterium]|nr:helix-turn-helix domain-containing protein [Armatimonadota bacterium]